MPQEITLQPFPEQNESLEMISKGLGERYKSCELKPHQIYEISINGQPMARCEDEKYRTVQRLRGIVQAGSEFFSVVEVFSTIGKYAHEYSVESIITKHIPGKNAEFVDYLSPDKPVAIGRSHQDNLNRTVSGEHFVIARAADGQMAVVDTESTNGTTVFTAYTEKDRPTNGTKLSRDSDNICNLYNNTDFWSANPAQAWGLVKDKYEPNRRDFASA